MRLKRIGTLALAILAMLGAAAARGQAAASAAPVDGLCFAQLAAPMSTIGPVCGSCSGQCHSDGVCKGKLAGDACNTSGGTCQIVGGCGMFDCCRCTSAFVVSPAAASDAHRPPPAQR